ncbi:MAG TPA: ABC transporter permease subunit [Actinomycetota bacterium]|jgi:ABC-2 type transport system permease protein|nr:ABC transporter permease subunit [Actinomycetota bacterium]
MSWRGSDSPEEMPLSVTAGAPAGAIYDRGYRHYQGAREGRSRLIKALMLAGVRRVLGLRRSWKAKVAPWGLLLIAFAPVVAFVGIRVIAGEAVDELIGYAQYLRVVSLVLLLFAASAGPELLCPDRQSNVLALYFTRPLGRSDYLLAKAAALLLVMGLIAVVPMAVLLAGNVLTADGAMTYLGDHLGDVPRILLAGGVLTVFYSVISLAIASLTERRSIAVAVQLGVFLASGIVAGTVFFTARFAGRRWVSLLALQQLPDRFVDWVFGEPFQQGSMAAEAGFTGPAYLVAMGVVCTLAFGLLAWRISRLRA